MHSSNGCAAYATPVHNTTHACPAMYYSLISECTHPPMYNVQLFHCISDFVHVYLVN